MKSWTQLFGLAALCVILLLPMFTAKNSTVVSENQEKVQIFYQEGKQAFERGQYRLSMQNLEAAANLVNYSSRQGGEIHMWLVTAYQAANLQQEAIDLCRKLTNHPHVSISKKAKNLLYIIEAPRLKRPAEWMSEIPDLSKMSESENQNRYVTNKKPKPSPQKSQSEQQLIDLSQVNGKDNQFIWFALLVFLLALLGFLGLH